MEGAGVLTYNEYSGNRPSPSFGYIIALLHKEARAKHPGYMECFAGEFWEQDPEWVMHNFARWLMQEEAK